MRQRHLQIMWTVAHTMTTVLESQPKQLKTGCLLHIGCATTLYACELDGIGGNAPSRCWGEPITCTRRVDWYLDSPVAFTKNENRTRYLLCRVKHRMSVGDVNIRSLLVARPMRRCHRTESSRLSPILGSLHTPQKFRAASHLDPPAGILQRK